MTCVACTNGTLKPQRWERAGVMQGWLRCTADTKNDRVGLYLSPEFQRECVHFDPVNPVELSMRLAAVRNLKDGRA